MNYYEVISRPVVTEKTMRTPTKAVFRVNKRATKQDIREAVEAIFQVKVAGVNTLVMPGKPKRAGRKIGRRAGFKKAVVTLADGFTLENLSTTEQLLGDDAAQTEETAQQD
jgi:large subunit ribosomal protein L23